MLRNRLAMGILYSLRCPGAWLGMIAGTIAVWCFL